MKALGIRLRRLEATLRPVSKPVSDPNRAMQRLALGRLLTKDMVVLCDIADRGKRESDWTEIESNAVKAFVGAFEQEVQGAGYRSIREFHRSCGTVGGGVVE
jgi:hypothetical protein